MAVIIFDQVSLTSEGIVRGSNGIGTTCWVFEAEAYLSWNGAVLGLKGGVEVAEGVKDSGLTNRNRFHKVP